MSHLDLNKLKARPIAELVGMARERRVEQANSLSRQQLIFEVLRAEGTRSGSVSGAGVLEVLGDGFGFLRDPGGNYLPGADDIYVSPSQIRRFNMRNGDRISGQVRAPKEGERYFALTRVEAVNGEDPEQSRDKVRFDNLVPVHPFEPLALERGADPATRLMDLFSPLGKGQRGLLVAPPRCGRSRLLRSIAASIRANHPDVHLTVLLLDERPEEVTEMAREVDAEVVSSTFDEQASRHVQVAEMVIERARRLVEHGRDVVILLDSLTRLARAYNQVVPPSGRQLGGGVDPAALHKPKRFFGAARKVDGGGSLTILATCLVGTGSRMDDVIYEEFRGRGNLELVLDAGAASEQLFPALDIAKSSTRRPEKLMAEADLKRIDALRRSLSGDVPDDLRWLLSALDQNPTNRGLLDNLTAPGN
jgi:transcription termination factor Rho